MTNQVPQPLLAKLHGFAALLLIGFTGTAVVFIAIGTIFGNEALERWGAALSLPAVVATLIPLGCVALLCTIWLVRGVTRLFASSGPGPTRPRREWAIMDPVDKPIDAGVELKPGAAAAKPRRGRPLTDDEIIEILLAFDRENRGAADDGAGAGAGAAAHDGAAVEAPVQPGDEQGQPHPPVTPSPTLGDLVVNAQARGITVTLTPDKKACVVPVPSTPAAFSPGSEFEQTCVDLLAKPRDLNTVVLDSRGLDHSMLDSFCDLLFRVIDRVGDVVTDTLCVAVSTAKDAMLDPLWRCVQRNTPNMDRRAQVAVYAALLTVFLGPIATA